MKTDPLFYRLFQERPATVFERVGRTVPEGCRYALHAEELKQTAQRVDGVLLPECEGGDVPLVFTEAQLYEDEDFYRRWLSAVFLLTELSREEIQQMLHLPETDLKKTRFYQDVFGEGSQEGRREGPEEGREEGRAREAMTLVLRLLQRRIGSITEEQERRIRALSTERLEALGEALLDCRSANDLETWLSPLERRASRRSTLARTARQRAARPRATPGRRQRVL